MASRAAEVKSVMRALFRARRRSFAGDVPMLSASASQIRSEFEANKNVTDPEKLDQLLLQARETAEFLVLNVVQAKLNDRGNYEIKLEESHVGNSIEEIGAKAPCSK